MTTTFEACPVEASESCAACGGLVRSAPSRWWCPRCGEGGSAVDDEMLRMSCAADVARARLARAETTLFEPPASPRLPLLEIEVDGRAIVVDAAVGSTVADLAAALGAGCDGLVLDGVTRGASVPLEAAGLARGSLVQPATSAGEVGGERVTLELRWRRGLDSGRVDALPAGPVTIGSAAGATIRLADPSVAAYHALARVGPEGRARVKALGGPVEPAAGSVAVGDRIEVGHSVALVASGGSRRPPPAPSSGWTIPFHRPPRPLPPPVPGPVVVPELPRRDARSAALGWASAATSVAAGLVVGLLFHSPLMLAMGAMGALGSLASAVALRRRHRRDLRTFDRSTVQALDRFSRELAGAHAAHLSHRRGGVPELADTVARARDADPRLWERRPGHADAFELLLGHGDEPWEPPLDGPVPAPDSPLGPALATHVFLSDVPRTVMLRPGTVLGLAGPRTVTEAVARSLLVQLAVHHGPADLVLVALTVPERAHGWRWVDWLPHAAELAAAEVGGHGAADVAGARAGDPVTPPGGCPRTVLLVDDPPSLVRRDTTARRIVAGGGAAIVLADDIGGLPALCTQVIELEPDGRGRAHRRDGHAVAGTVQAVGIGAATAAEVARSLARHDDPERATARQLPAAPRLLDLTAWAADPAGVEAAWAENPTGRPAAALGVSTDGRFDLDLEHDGPHALVVGTTGAGKSELLRTLVASLAAACRPDDVSFVLVDYKGGSAFDACAELPHVVGVLTDLDEAMAARALRSLDAELKRRERVLRDAGAVDLDALRRSGDSARLARLVLVVDEFATLAADLPDFLGSLIGVAQRGRSLGVHLVLATQRPGGGLRDDIRANVNCRIALRLHGVAESIDVIGGPDAATIRRDRPGQAYARLGPGELIPLQVALVSAPSPPVRAPVEVWPRGEGSAPRFDGPSDLERMVDAIRAAAARLDIPAPPRPWCDPLPDLVPLADLPAGAMVLADEPDHQRRVVDGWTPEQGHLVVVGPPGRGRSNALAAAVLALARARPPDVLHAYVLDLGSGSLEPLAGLPHCGALVRAAEDERRRRLFRWLASERRRRLSAAPGDGAPALVIAIDGLGALLALGSDTTEHEAAETLARLVADGASIDIHLAVAAERPAAVPAALDAAAAERWALAGTPDGAGPHTDRPGRARDRRGREVQIASATPLTDSVAAIAASCPRPRQRPHPIGVLPAAVDLADLPPPSTGSGATALPIGVGDDDLAPVALRLHPGDHVVVAGPARSGKSTALAVLATQLRSAHPDAVLIGTGPRPTPLERVRVLDDWLDGGIVSRLAPTATYLFVDDADGVDGIDEIVGRPNVTVVAAATADALRAAYGHWTQRVRRSRLGLLLRPDRDLDGDLLGIGLPRRTVVAPLPGRGYLVQDGHAEVVQCARLPVLSTARDADDGRGPRRRRGSRA